MTRFLRVKVRGSKHLQTVMIGADGRVAAVPPLLKKHLKLTEADFRDLCRKNAWAIEDANPEESHGQAA